MKTLILLAKAPASETTELAARGELPRPEYEELQKALGAELLDFHDVERSRHPAVRAAARKSPRWGLAMLGFLRRREFDHIYATGEDVGIPFATLCKGARWLGRVTVVIHNGGTPKRRVLLRALGHEVWRNVICLGEEQRRVLVEDIGLPAYKVHRFPQWLDGRFYDPALASDGAKGEYVLSVGRESRDYPTLERAARGLPLRFHVVASGWAPHAGFDVATNISSGANVTVEKGGLPYPELRERYGRARFVVAPLNRVTYAAGVTSICEAMAMGKAVVATASPGILDYVKPGVSGLVVPVGDAEALRRAVVELWDDEERCAEMGRHNRRWVEDVLSTDRYVERVVGLLGGPAW